ATTNPGNNGTIEVELRDGETGRPVRSIGGLYSQNGFTNGADGVVFDPSSSTVYLAAPTVNILSGYFIKTTGDVTTVGTRNLLFAGASLSGGVTVDGLQGVSRLAITPPTSDGTIFGPRVSLYALAPGENALTAFDVSATSAAPPIPPLAFVQANED